MPRDHVFESPQDGAQKLLTFYIRTPIILYQTSYMRSLNYLAIRHCTTRQSQKYTRLYTVSGISKVSIYSLGLDATFSMIGTLHVYRL